MGYLYLWLGLSFGFLTPPGWANDLGPQPKPIPSLRYSPALVGKEREMRLVERSLPGINLFLHEHHEQPSGVILVELLMPSSSLEAVVARGLGALAWVQSNFSERQTLQNIDIQSKVLPNAQGWQISVAGPSQHSLPILNRLLRSLRHFEPSHEQWQWAQSKLREQIVREHRDGPSLKARRELQSILDPQYFSNDAMEAQINRMSLDQIQQTWSHEFDRLDARVIASGDFYESQLLDLARHLDNLFSRRLHEEQRSRRFTELSPLEHAKNLHYWKATPDECHFGQAQLHCGPALLSLEAAATRAIGALLLNRAIQRPGSSVRSGATLMADHKRLHLVLTGECDDSHHQQAVFNDVEFLADQARQGQWSADEISLVLQSLSQHPDCAIGDDWWQVRRAQSALRSYGSLAYADHARNHLQQLKPDDVVDVGRSLFRDAYAVRVSVSGNETSLCDSVFTSSDSLQRHLRGLQRTPPLDHGK